MQIRRTRHFYRHKLVAIGDSLAQGFKNGCIHRTDLSFPALISRCFSPGTRFDTPSFSAQGGIPINLETLIRGLSEKFGESLSWSDALPAAHYLYTTLRRIKIYWENERNHRNRFRKLPYHNQAVWGYAANDSWLMTERKCREFLVRNRPRYSVFSVLPDHSMYITSRLVLNPGFTPEFENNSQIDNVRHLHEEGGIENLIACTAHNNIIGSLSALRVTWSEPGFMERHHYERPFTVYRPEHLREELKHLYRQIAAIGIPNVFVPTIPYLTILPVVRGVNEDRSRPHTGYFDYYTRFWIWDDDFDPERNPHLTKEEAMELDRTVDEYNGIIRELCGEFGFHVVPIHRYVNAVARRRLGVDALRPFPPDFIRALRSHPSTSHLVTADGKVRLSTDYLRVDEEDRKVIKGGVFSLDGLHPTTIGYGLMAHIYMMTMEKAGVKFERTLDWNHIIENEPLVTDPPYLLSELRLMLRLLSMDRQERFTRLGQNILHQLLDLFSRRPRPSVRLTGEQNA